MSSRVFSLISVLLLTLLMMVQQSASAENRFDQRPEVQSFMHELNTRHHFSMSSLQKLFATVTLQEKILAAMEKPAEAKPWHAYRKLLVTEARVNHGVDFWAANAEWLERAEIRYGVPARMIVAIIGVETSYGQNTGHYRVVDALSTLAFAYPRRASFFRKELEQYLILCREEGVDPAAPNGSYAGAMGLPQFMPSSFRTYAVDLDGDGKRDIWQSPADAIGSVAKYFMANGWEHGEPVVAAAHLAQGNTLAPRASGSMKPDESLQMLAAEGITPLNPPLRVAKAHLFSLEEESGRSWWLSLHNFYVITRYNHSPLYAMAAWELGEQIAAKRSNP